MSNRRSRRKRRSARSCFRHKENVLLDVGTHDEVY